MVQNWSFVAKMCLRLFLPHRKLLYLDFGVVCEWIFAWGLASLQGLDNVLVFTCCGSALTKLEEKATFTSTSFQNYHKKTQQEETDCPVNDCYQFGESSQRQINEHFCTDLLMYVIYKAVHTNQRSEYLDYTVGSIYSTYLGFESLLLVVSPNFNAQRMDTNRFLGNSVSVGFLVMEMQ